MIQHNGGNGGDGVIVKSRFVLLLLKQRQGVFLQLALGPNGLLRLLHYRSMTVHITRLQVMAAT